MKTKFVRELENGETVDVFVAVEEREDRVTIHLNAYENLLWMYKDDISPDTMDMITHNLDSLLAFLHDTTNRSMFLNGDNFGLAIDRNSYYYEGA